MLPFEHLYENYVQTAPDTLRNELTRLLSERGIWQEARFDSCFQVLEEYNDRHCPPENNPFFSSTGRRVRRSGEPHVNHSYRTALILLRMNITTDPDVVIAALLHDIEKDTEYTLAQAKAEFGAAVAALLRCLSRVNHDQKKILDANLPEASADYSRIIDKCREHPQAFNIKFAERLDVLLTLGNSHPNRQMRKLEDTQKYLLPLIKTLHAGLFCRYIEDALFRLEQAPKKPTANRHRLITSRLDALNAFHGTERTRATLEQALRYNGNFCGLELVLPTACEIDRQLKEKGLSAKQFALSDFRYEVKLIVRSNAPIPTMKDVVIRFLSDPLLADFTVEYVGKSHLYLRDGLNNRYRLGFISQRDYIAQTYGADGNQFPLADAYTLDDDISDENKILVYKRHGDAVPLKEGSTVIDFAFRIGQDAGIYLSGATVNGKPATPFTVLHDDDEVELVQSPERESLIDMSWLLHCATNNARHKLCKYLQNQMDSLKAQLAEQQTE